jgi:hypothetical protein
MKIPYKEGDWFAVPIKSGFVVGRIARAQPRKAVLVGYFFKPLHLSLPTKSDTHELKAQDAFYIARFSHLGFVLDNWPVIYRPDDWKREEWPMPPFGRLFDFVPGAGFVTTYDDKEILRTVSERAVSAEEAMRMPQDGGAGCVFLQNVLERYFTEGYPPYDPTERKRHHFWFNGLPTIEN